LKIYPLFDTVPQNPTPSTPNETAVGDYMRGAWAAFAKDVHAGLLSYAEGWPLYNQTAETLVRLAYDNQPGANLALGSAYDGRCASL
jgi:cholinesterase